MSFNLAITLFVLLYAGEHVELSTQPLYISLTMDIPFDAILTDVTSHEYAELRYQIVAGVSIFKIIKHDRIFAYTMR